LFIFYPFSLPMNPFLNLKYETVIEDLGEDYSDRVPAASFPEYTLRFRAIDFSL
jgi:hypothetical protein